MVLRAFRPPGGPVIIFYHSLESLDTILGEKYISARSVDAYSVIESAVGKLQVASHHALRDKRL